MKNSISIMINIDIDYIDRIGNSKVIVMKRYGYPLLSGQRLYELATEEQPVNFALYRDKVLGNAVFMRVCGLQGKVLRELRSILKGGTPATQSIRVGDRA